MCVVFYRALDWGDNLTTCYISALGFPQRDIVSLGELEFIGQSHLRHRASLLNWWLEAQKLLLRKQFHRVRNYILESYSSAIPSFIDEYKHNMIYPYRIFFHNQLSLVQGIWNKKKIHFRQSTFLKVLTQSCSK